MRESFKNLKKLPYPFCNGCSHSPVLDQLDSALVKLGAPEHKIVLVTDIGCIGMSEQYFFTHGFHGLHGRVITYATGIKLADPSLTVVALQGDGGMGIGGHHMLNAAKRNIDITVLVCNNFNFGMTGGQHSVTTPEEGKTTTTRWGNIERPLDIAGTAAINGAAFAARLTAFDEDLEDVLLEALKTKGFSLLDIWELCTAYYTKSNKLSRTKLNQLIEETGLTKGVVHREGRADYLTAYKEKYKEVLGTPTIEGNQIKVKYGNNLGGGRYELFLAGSAGQRIKSTATLLGRAGVMSGLWVTQQDDYPVTVQSGHSISHLIFHEERIDYMQMVKPDAIIILSSDGLKKAELYLPMMNEGDHVFIISDLLPIETDAEIHILNRDALKESVGKQHTAIAGVAEYLRHSGIFPLEALEDSVRAGRKQGYIEKGLKAIRNSRGVLE